MHIHSHTINEIARLGMCIFALNHVFVRLFALHLLQSFAIIIRVNELKTIVSEFPSKFKGFISLVFLFLFLFST